MISAILFDLDGTLVNTDPIHFATWQEMLRQWNLEIDLEFYQTYISGRINSEIVQDILPQISLAAGLEVAEAKETLFRQRGAQLQPLAGLTRILEWTESLKIKRAVVTNAPKANAHFMLSALGLTDTFPVVVLAEDAKEGKPHPAPYQLAMELLEVTPESVLVFEDSPTGVRSAVSAGIYTIGVTTTHTPETLLQLGAKQTIADFTAPHLWDYLTQVKA